MEQKRNRWKKTARLVRDRYGEDLDFYGRTVRIGGWMVRKEGRMVGAKRGSRNHAPASKHGRVKRFEGDVMP